MNKIIFATIATLLLISCATVPQAKPQAPDADKVQARLVELEPQVKAALEKVKALPSYVTYEASRKATEAEGKKVEATAEWKAYLKLVNEQAYLKKLVAR